MAYLRPVRLEEAIALMARTPCVPLAGGTDFYPARTTAGPDETVLDLAGIAALRGVAVRPDGVRIGALATWTELLAAPLPPLFDGLKQAAARVGGRQVQNAGTLGGNLCNASPAADGIACLLALDATVELAGPAGTRRLKVAEFVLGNRRTARAPDEILAAIEVPLPPAPARSVFLKLGARAYLVISIVMVAATALYDGSGRVRDLRLAVGAAGPRALRLPAAERAALAGEVLGPGHLAVLSPIDDMRASASYRTEAALVLLRRALAALR